MVLQSRKDTYSACRMTTLLDGCREGGKRASFEGAWLSIDVWCVVERERVET